MTSGRYRREASDALLALAAIAAGARGEALRDFLGSPACATLMHDVLQALERCAPPVGPWAGADDKTPPLSYAEQRELDGRRQLEAEAEARAWSQRPTLPAPPLPLPPPVPAEALRPRTGPNGTLRSLSPPPVPPRPPRPFKKR